MGSHIYVGNLRSGVSEDAVGELFRPFGTVLKVLFPISRDTGAPRGFAFVTMGSPAQAAAALAGLGPTIVDGRAVTLKITQDWPAGLVDPVASTPAGSG